MEAAPVGRTQSRNVPFSPPGHFPHRMSHSEPGQAVFSAPGQQGCLTGRSIISPDTDATTSVNVEVSGISLNINLCQPDSLLTAGKKGQVPRCKLMGQEI